MAPPDSEVPYGTLDLMVLKTLAGMGPLHGSGLPGRAGDGLLEERGRAHCPVADRACVRAENGPGQGGRTAGRLAQSGRARQRLGKA